MTVVLFPLGQGMISRPTTITTALNISGSFWHQSIAPSALTFAKLVAQSFSRQPTTDIFPCGRIVSLAFMGAAIAFAPQRAPAELPTLTLPAPFVALDLNVGDSQDVSLPGGGQVTVKLLEVHD